MRFTPNCHSRKPEQANYLGNIVNVKVKRNVLICTPLVTGVVLEGGNSHRTFRGVNAFDCLCDLIRSEIDVKVNVIFIGTCI